MGVTRAFHRQHSLQGSRKQAHCQGWWMDGVGAPGCLRVLEAARRDLWSGAGQTVTDRPVQPSLSSEMTVCISLSAELSLELPVTEQELMELDHKAGRTGDQGHAECTCRTSGGTPWGQQRLAPSLSPSVLLWPPDPLCGPNFLRASVRREKEKGGHGVLLSLSHLPGLGIMTPPQCPLL